MNISEIIKNGREEMRNTNRLSGETLFGLLDGGYNHFIALTPSRSVDILCVNGIRDSFRIGNHVFYPDEIGRKDHPKRWVLLDAFERGREM